MKPLCAFCIFLVMLLTGELTAQPRCGFDIRHKARIGQDLQFAQTVIRSDEKIHQWILQKQEADKLRPEGRVPNGAETIYEIPVVIHVIHTGGAAGTNYNPSDAQLMAMMDYLNQSFQATWPSYSAVGAGGTRVPFRFVLAQRAPDCSPTNGIVRVNGSGVTNYSTGGIAVETSTGVAEASVKSLSIWPATQYYNVWVVNRIDGKDGYVGTVGPFIAGYAYFPGAGIDIDGTVMLASQARAGSSTLPHEMGHAFSLYHTFQGSSGSTCPPNTSCATQGDRVCDTDPTNEEAFFTCPLSTDLNPCTGNPWNGQETNFMHYTSCADRRFTPGQRDRMIATVNAIRTGLMSSAGLQPPPTLLTRAANCSPTSTANQDNGAGIGPMRVRLNTLDDSTFSYSDDLQFYQDKSCNMGATLLEGQSYPLSVSTRYNAQIVKVWIDFNDNGDLETSELVLNSMTPAGVPGNNYTHTLSVTAPSTAVQDRPLRMRVFADWVDNEFATACTDLLYGQVEDYSVTILSASALPVKIYDERIRLVNGAAHFTFKCLDAESIVRYELQRSDEGGVSFKTVQVLPVAATRTFSGALLAVDEFPVKLGWYRIVAYSQSGKSYHSRILAMPAAGTITDMFKLYPNPTAGAFNLMLPLPPGTEVQLFLADSYGKKVWQGTRTAGAVTRIDEKLAPGMYFLTVISGNYKSHTKLVVTGR